MIQVIRNKDRYHFETDWLSTYWHFSFDHYNDPANESFGPLRVFNDDVIQPAGGFPFHSHREMEIVTYIIDGQLEHKDSMGNVGVISPGEIQRMSAGTGVRHSEYNASKAKPAHLIQLWIFPAKNGLAPSWEQKQFSLADRQGKLLPIALPVDAIRKNGAGKDRVGKDRVGKVRVENDRVGKDDAHAVRIYQDATIYTSSLAPGQSVTHALAKGRRAYLFLIGGDLDVNGEKLHAGDQGRITDASKLTIAAPKSSNGAAPADFLLLDLP
jgi:redox-sensitive bicupin YhaK (pirin superfamily)